LAKYEAAILDSTKSLELLEILSFPPTSPNASPSASPAELRNSNQSSLFLKLYLRRADCYAKTDKWEEAVRDYRVASEINPEDSSMFFFLFFHFFFPPFLGGFG